jgi:hypothetical protein
MGRSDRVMMAFTARNRPSLRMSPRLMPSGDSIRATLVLIM